MEICKYSNCTACGACLNICPHKCIAFKEDEYGELHPNIESSTCIACGLCKKVCPILNPPHFYYPSHCYAAWNTNKENRSICASGGIGSIMSEYVIREKKGVVFGTEYDSNLTPITTFTETLEGIEKYKGSKYVQSQIGSDIFKKIRRFLTQGRYVLYIATPCQIAGLINYLGKNYTNLITVDLICHGVCPSSYLHEEVKRLESRYKLSNISNIRFRGNDGNNFQLTLWSKDKQKLYPGTNFFNRLQLDYDKQQYYLTGFLLGVTLRENCYSCSFARPERVADITIGDFIGLGTIKPWKNDVLNVSSVTTNSEKGLLFYQELSSKIAQISSYERPYEERLNYKPSLLEPYTRHPLNIPFRQMYKENGYNHAIQGVLEAVLQKNCCKKRKKIILTPYYYLRKMVGILLRFFHLK